MSLALFHELQGAQQSVDAVVSGSFTQPGETEFITLCSSKIVLYRVVSDEISGQRLRYVFSPLVFNVMYINGLRQSNEAVL